VAVYAIATSGCLPSGDLKHRGPVVPEDLGDGWVVATPQSEGLDAELLAEIHDELLRPDRYFTSLGLLIVKNGHLVFETYLRDSEDRDLFHHIQSATKSVTSIAFGVARDRGLFGDLTQTLGELAPAKVAGLEADKASISLEHLLTMRSGIDFDNDHFSVEMWVDRPDDGFRYILEKPLYARPGEEFFYRDADPQMLTYLLEEAGGVSEAEWVDTHVFRPLGITDYRWNRGTDTTMGAHGLFLRARDMAKLGQLMLDRGSWNGTEIVSEAWCDQATTSRVPAAETGAGLDYGYYWWVDSEHDGYLAWGKGGQFVLVVPAQDLVAVQIAYPDAEMHGSQASDFIDLLSDLLGW